jgi:hypothetical protein
MIDCRGTISRWVLTSSLVLGAVSTGGIFAQDLSRYRDFQLGSDLPAVAKQAGADPSQATVLHSRPALIQTLTWLPWLPGSASKTEAVKRGVFIFYNGELFQVTIDYDRYQIAGLTAADMIEAISAYYGIASKPTSGAASKPTSGADVAPVLYGDQQEVLAEWQDAEYRFDLIRGTYGSTFRLVGVLKRLEAPFRAATIEAVRLDEKEAPQREAARVAKANEAEKITLEQDRLLNKPTFRP